MGRLHAFLCTLVIMAAASPVHADEPSTQQKIAMQAKPSVVRVWGAYIGTFDVAGTKVTVGIGGTGTGWFMTPDGYIATNAHVVQDIKNGDDAAKSALLKQFYKDVNKQYGAEIAKMSQSQFDAFNSSLQHSVQLKNIEARHYIVMPDGTKLDYEVKEYGKPGTGKRLRDHQGQDRERADAADRRLEQVAGRGSHRRDRLSGCGGFCGPARRTNRSSRPR